MKLHLYGVYAINRHNPIEDDGMGLAVAKNHVQAKSLVYRAFLEGHVDYKDLFAKRLTPEECGDDPESGTTVQDLKDFLENATSPEVFG